MDLKKVEFKNEKVLNIKEVLDFISARLSANAMRTIYLMLQADKPVSKYDVLFKVGCAYGLLSSIMDKLTKCLLVSKTYDGFVERFTLSANGPKAISEYLLRELDKEERRWIVNAFRLRTVWKAHEDARQYFKMSNDYIRNFASKEVDSRGHTRSFKYSVLWRCIRLFGVKNKPVHRDIVKQTIGGTTVILRRYSRLGIIAKCSTPQDHYVLGETGMKYFNTFLRIKR